MSQFLNSLGTYNIFALLFVVLVLWLADRIRVAIEYTGYSLLVIALGMYGLLLLGAQPVIASFAPAFAFMLLLIAIWQILLSPRRSDRNLVRMNVFHFLLGDRRPKIPLDAAIGIRRPNRMAGLIGVLLLIIGTALGVLAIQQGSERFWDYKVSGWTDESGAYLPDYEQLGTVLGIAPGFADWYWTVGNFITPVIVLLAFLVVRLIEPDQKVERWPPGIAFILVAIAWFYSAARPPRQERIPGSEPYLSVNTWLLVAGLVPLLGATLIMVLGRPNRYIEVGK